MCVCVCVSVCNQALSNTNLICNIDLQASLCGKPVMTQCFCRHMVSECVCVHAYVEEQPKPSVHVYVRVCVCVCCCWVGGSFLCCVCGPKGGRKGDAVRRLHTKQTAVTPPAPCTHTHTHTHTHTQSHSQIHKCMLGCSASYIRTLTNTPHTQKDMHVHTHTPHASSNFGCLARLPVAMATVAHSTLQPESMAAPRQG